MPTIEHLDGWNVYLVHDFLSEDECRAWIDRSEAIGYGDAPITLGRGHYEVRKDVRNNTRVMIDDVDAAAAMYRRVSPFIQKRLRYWTACGVNERFRLYRYDPGQRFAPHYDGAFDRTDFERSQLTFMVYLNEVESGGATVFFDDGDRQRLRVVPRTGTALIFVHAQLHEGSPVMRGRKYVLRTDVMYRRPSLEELEAVRASAIRS